MKIPTLQGIIRRRMLINFRVAPEALRKSLPAPFHLKLHRGHAIAGICLIRLEHIRPVGLPAVFGLTSENAAHRVAVEWTYSQGENREGVFIYRRDTTSSLSHFAGGRIFPGKHNLGKFDVEDNGRRVALAFASFDGETSVRLLGEEADALPASSCFESLAESSRWFERGCVGYSPARDARRLDGIRLATTGWNVRPFAVKEVVSSWFDTLTRKYPGAAEFDHALIMRDIPHEWHSTGGPL